MKTLEDQWIPQPNPPENEVTSFPGLLRLQFLIACSMQKWREKVWFHHVICGMADVTDSRRNIRIHSYREARESKQVPEEG